jgi:hypothetical protein
MNVEEINKKLIEVYGKDISLSLPNYKIVWSTSELEKRLGTFTDVTESGIYLRTVTEVREVPKYWNNPDQWVLEAIQANIGNPELGTLYSYEPLWIFGANKSDPTPIWRAVDIICKCHKIIDKRKLSKSDIQGELDNQLIREKALFKEMLQDESPYIAGAIHDGAAVVVPSTYEKRSDDI